MTKFVTWTGSERILKVHTNHVESFILDAPTLALKEVTLSNMPDQEEFKVSAYVVGFTPMENGRNFTVTGDTLLFDDPSLAGGTPPLNSELRVDYYTSVLEDKLKENPEIKALIAYTHASEEIKVACWLHVDGQTVIPNTVNVEIKEFGVNKVVLTGLTPDAEGVCYASSSGIALDPTKLYIAKVNVGTTDKNYTQHVPLLVEKEDVDPAAVASEMWDVSIGDANTNGTMGRLVNDIHTFNTGQYIISFLDKTLTIYDKDNTTPLFVYDLYDKNGTLSTSNVFERIPRP